MTSPRPEVSIRRARPEDLESLLEIGDVYGGRDYFRNFYPSFMADPDIYPLVAVADGKAIGFYMNHVLDGRLTVIKRAGRVHPAYRGQGIFHRLSDQLDVQRRRNWPAVKYEIFATHSIGDRARKEFQEKGFVRVVQKRAVNMLYRGKNLRAPDDLNQFAHVTEMTYDDVKLLFSHNGVTRQLFPNQRIFNWFIGYRLMESNIPFIVGPGGRVFATTSTHGIPPPVCSSSRTQPPFDNRKPHNFTAELIDGIDIISFSHLHHCNLGLFYELDIYTRGDEYQASTLTAHVQKHLHELSQLPDPQGVILVTFHFQVSGDLVVDILSRHGITEVIPDTEIYKVLYEKQL